MNAAVAQLINEQINKEFYSAYLYLDFANYYAAAGLDGFENWYYPEDVVVSDTVDDVFICTYDLSVLEDLTGDTSVIFSGFDKEVAVPVDLAQW